MARLRMKDHQPGDVVLVTKDGFTGPAIIGHHGALLMPGPGPSRGWSNSTSYPDQDWQAVELVELPVPK